MTSGPELKAAQLLDFDVSWEAKSFGASASTALAGRIADLGHFAKGPKSKRHSSTGLAAPR